MVAHEDVDGVVVVGTGRSTGPGRPDHARHEELADLAATASTSSSSLSTPAPSVAVSADCPGLEAASGNVPGAVPLDALVEQAEDGGDVPCLKAL